MQARDLMTEDPACCTPDDTVRAAARLMEQKDCGCIPVIESRDNNSVIGVITDRDIAVRGVSRGLGPDTPVRELMTTDVCCCSSDANLRDVEQMMSDNQVRRVVIIDDGGCCVGIVAQADIARAATRRAEVSDSEVGKVVERISEPPANQIH